MNFGGLPTMAWWPGPDVVDWIGISLFEQVYAGVDGLRPAHSIAAFAANQSKPLMIAESTPLGLGVIRIGAKEDEITLGNVWE